MLKLYTDGACSGNPGPGGWAFKITNIPEFSSLRLLSDAGRENNTTNNRMEMIAIIEGLTNIWNVYGDKGLIEVITDSNLIVQTMTKGWKRNVNIDLWDRLDAFAANMAVTWTWAPRNSAPELEWCDKRAKEMSHLTINPIKNSLPTPTTPPTSPPPPTSALCPMLSPTPPTPPPMPMLPPTLPTPPTPPLKTLQKEIHETSIAKGWWPESEVRNVGEIFTNIHAEISEAWELHRTGAIPQDVWFNAQSDPPNKPEGIGIELADAMIRILDYAEANGLNMDSLLRQKMEYNKSRSFRHGGKLA